MSESDIAKMTRRWRRTMEFQAPDMPFNLHQPPDAIVVRDVCSICKKKLAETGCPEHGLVFPMRSAVANES